METSKEKRQRIISLYIVHTSMFVFALGNSVIMMGVWPYLQSLDSSTTMFQYGFIVATDALGQLLFAPVFGAIADKLGTIRPLAITCSIIFTAGNLLYSMISLVPRSFGALKQARYVAMLVARFVVGIGTASVAPNRLYVSKATNPKERTTHIALLSMFQNIGFIVGPAIQAALSPIGEGNGKMPTNSGFHFDMYSACGYVSASTGLASVILFLPCVFKEFSTQEAGKSNGNAEDDTTETLNIAEAEEMNGKDNANPHIIKKDRKPRELLKQYSRISIVDGTSFQTNLNRQQSVKNFNNTGLSLQRGLSKKELINALNRENTEENQGRQYPNCIATCACLFIFFSTLFNFVLGATIATPFAMDMWGWSREETVRYLGITMTIGGIVGAACFGSIGPLAKRFDERNLLLFMGIIPMIIARLITIPLGSELPPMFSNSTSANGTVEIELGCRYQWCLEIPKVTMYQFFIGYFITVMSYPFSMALTSALYAGILGNIPQGFWMGILTTSGSLARVIGPIGVSFVYQAFGTYFTFGGICTILTLALLAGVLSYPHLKPPEHPKPIKEEESLLYKTKTTKVTFVSSNANGVEDRKKSDSIG